MAGGNGWYALLLPLEKRAAGYMTLFWSSSIRIRALINAIVLLDQSIAILRPEEGHPRAVPGGGSRLFDVGQRM